MTLNGEMLSPSSRSAARPGFKVSSLANRRRNASAISEHQTWLHKHGANKGKNPPLELLPSEGFLALSPRYWLQLDAKLGHELAYRSCRIPKHKRYIVRLIQGVVDACVSRLRVIIEDYGML